jgi:hypothetical protein
VRLALARYQRGRTADLPIFRTLVVCPAPVGTVHDVRRSSLAVAGGRPQTKANGTEMETTREGAWE